jgi:hypothetical protein
MMSEASIGTYQERIAVGWTILNRASSPDFPNTICGVVNQRGQYATNQNPTQEMIDLASSLIANPGADITGGATHFFSPISMPKEGENTGGYDVGGGLHEVAGINGRVYFPSWALTLEYVGDIAGVRPAYYMFYRMPGRQVQYHAPEPEQVTLTLFVHDGGRNGPKLSGVEVSGQDAAGNSFGQTTSEDGYVTLDGVPGTWQFNIFKEGYQPVSWSQDIAGSVTKHAFFS